MLCVIHKTFVMPVKWHRHCGHVNRFTYLLIITGNSGTGKAAGVDYTGAKACHCNSFTLVR